MALSQRHLLLAGFSGFVSWGLVVNWIPFLRYLGYAFIAGVLFTCLCICSAILLTVKTRSDYFDRRTTVPNLRFLAADAWSTEVSVYRKATEYEAKSLYPQSFVVSESIDELLQLASRDFIGSWYGNISKNRKFINEIDRALRIALENIRNRLSSEDVTSLVVSRIVPILTAHIKDFDRAERAVRGRNLARSVTESEELGLAIASKYRDGRLHPAVTVSLVDQKLIQQDYVRKLVMGLLPQLLPDSLLTSRTVSVLIREIVACAVLLPVINLLSDPDTWNQILEIYGRTALNDRKTVKKLRAALDKHASPSKPKGSPSFPRLGPNDSERAFERFVRAIRRCNNLSDARQFRAQVASQLKRESMVEGQDQVYIRRLETGKRVLDQKVSKLAANASIRRPASMKPEFRRDSIPNHKDVSLVDLMHDASGLSYFMEFMDRQNKMSLVQFWIVVDGFRNPLEDDFGDENSASSAVWTSADVSDMILINETYLSKPELNVPEESRDAVKAFLKAGKKANPEQYRKARTAILMTQSAILEEMEIKYYPKFKDSDLFYKYLASDETSLISAEQERPPRASTPAPEQRERRPLPPLMTRTQSQPSMQKPQDLRRAAVSNDVQSNGKLFDDADSSPRRSVDSDRSAPLFDDDYDTDPLSHSFSMSSQNGDSEAKNTQVIENMEQALNEIIVDQPNNGRSEDSRLFGADSSSSSLFPEREQISARSSSEVPRSDVRSGEKNKPSIASLGLIENSSRTGVFEDELFPDEKKFIEDEYADPEGDEKDPADEIHQAAPGDLGLTEAIVALTEEIEKLSAQESVLDTLTRKAELTNNTAELRILGKSKASIQREIRRKEMQRQQYVIQESDNSLYGRSTIHIQSIMVGKEDDGNEFAIYVIEVRRKAGEQMPAATWAVPRRYSEFHELHQKLRMRYPSVRQLEFPRRRMMMKLQKDFLQKRRAALEAYLQQLLLLPEVCRSRDFRAFLSQQALLPHDAPATEGETKDIVSRIYNSVADGMDDFLGNIAMLDQLSTAGQNLISAATSQLTGPEPALATEDAVTAAEAEAELNAFEDRELEPFIKPICDLFLEAFELNRGNNWLRGRAVVVVLHQLLGGTIERKVRESAKSLVQDDNLLRYLSLAKETMWPGGVLRQSVVRTPSQKSKTKNEASFMLAALIPDLAGNVVGRANAQAASRKIYDILNNPRLNAHLIFTILDEIVLVLFGGTDGGRSRQQSTA
ncbi:intermediate filament protein (Mdm1), putative [Talaromyces stipitatus ATCC 10500]|uniref:Intermediate filament protein (Mdm1), putative n=1 Tax=Talaromyces stipitatus (strain ATCC 10500 / CBS 375.48 / QM 6759 / NRRL 1006) TaxID=441959 RepID=B8M741_TALSN|nr:intermediate filament protein (Mdm1), putative [Talaromyces stipitatus ATCC 10500]EED20261.1 intermediate filament protein (Mdm1), putative [Talaromyces stipitatus ATCC 10500]